MNENLTKTAQEKLNSGLNESGLEASSQLKKIETPEDLLRYAEESKQSVDSSVKEVLSTGKELEVKNEGVKTGEAVAPEIQNMHEIDKKAEAIGGVIDETIDSVAKGQEASPLGDLLSKVREKISAIKTGVTSKIDAFKEKREQKAQEKLHEQENEQKLELIKNNPLLQEIVSPYSGTRLDAYAVEEYSLSSIKLCSENPYIKVVCNNGRISPDEFNQVFQEENLRKCSEIYSDKKEIPYHDLNFYVEKFGKAPQWVQDIVLQERTKDGLGLTYYARAVDISRTFDEKQVATFKKLSDEGAIPSFNNSEYQLNAIKALGDKIDLLTSDDIKNIHGDWDIDRLKGVTDLSPEDIPKFQYIRQALGGYKHDSGEPGFGSYRCLEIFDLLKQADGDSNIIPLFDWAYAANENKYKIEEFIKENFSNYKAQMGEYQETRQRNKKFGANVELIPEERMTLGFVCERIKKVEAFLPQIKELAGDHCFKEPWQISEYIDDLEKDPISTLIDGGDKIGSREVYLHYNDFKEFFAAKNISFSKEDQMRIYDRISPNTAFGGTTAFKPAEFPLDQDVKREIVDKLASEKPELCYENFNGFEQYLSVISNPEEKQTILDKIFDGMKINRPDAMLYKSEFPLTPEQNRFVSLMKRISTSQSKELKNMGAEIASIVAKEESFEGAEVAIDKIEKVFLRNNIPFIGKQFKIFEILYPDQKLDSAAERSFVPSLKENHSNNSRRLTIFKDLLHANFDSLNVNLEQYLHILKDGQDVLEKSESSASLSPEENQKLLSFCKKINAMSENVGHESVDLSGVSDEQTIKTALDDLRSSFGVREGETIIQRFERTFLQRIGIQSLDEALGVFDKKRQETDVRNREFAKSGSMTLEATDLVKGFRSDYIDTVLDRGVYSPEFIGADTSDASRNAKTSDATPLDTDMILVGDRNLENIATNSVASGYGDLMMIMKDRGQFKDELELVNNVVVGPDQRGVRTGFGSTQIEGLIAKQSISPRRMEEIKFSIAKKGFYIPISNQGGEVIFSPDDFDKYRKIFAGVDRYHGEPIKIDSQWKNSAQAGKIEQYAQTEANIESIDVLRKHIFDDIQAALSEQGIGLNEGKYAESILGASISDTGSTGRGSALDEGYDFDFAVKLDDRDWGKVQNIVAKLSQKYSFPDHYNQSGMEMYRSKDFDLDGKKISLDIGFVKKSDVEAFDTNDSIAEKYAWIKDNLGEQAYLDAMTNIRFAKKTLKDAGCYKKGADRSAGQQGGLGGIGVEHWIMQNNGDAVEAFRDFYKNVYQDGQPLSFEDFRKKYKVFSAGENIRNNMKAEDFMFNMDEDGYKKMAELSKQFV